MYQLSFFFYILRNFATKNNRVCRRLRQTYAYFFILIILCIYSKTSISMLIMITVSKYMCHYQILGQAYYLIGRNMITVILYHYEKTALRSSKRI